MGFYLRKSIRVGPLRFNLSKSGLGISGGFKGFRLGTGPRGNYVHMGAHGIYYRASIPNNRAQKINHLSPSDQSLNTKRQEVEITPNYQGYGDFVNLDNGNTSNMCDSTSMDLLEEIRSKHKKNSYWPIGAVTTILLMYLSSQVGDSPVYVGLLGLVITVLLFYRDKLRKTIILFYDLDDTKLSAWKTLYESFANIANCGRVRHIYSAANVTDQKRNAGANRVVQSAIIHPQIKDPQNIKTNIPVPSVSVGSQIMIFLPDRLLIFDKENVGAINYKDLQLNIERSSFIETNSVPSDATIIGRTWQYVNKNGGPDKRFSHNPEIPICLYEYIHFKSLSGLQKIIELSKLDIAEKFKIAVVAMTIEHK